MFYTDDSGVKAGGSRLLVIGGIKVRKHGALLRAIRHVRDQCDFRGEFKFTAINKGSVSAYYAMIDELEKSDAHLIACVTHRPPGSGQADWRFYSDVTARLLRGNITRRELVGVHMDMISTPRTVAFDDVVRGKVNRSLAATRIVSAACLDSCSCDGLQVADLVAGAVAFDRRLHAGESGKAGSIKGRVVSRLKTAFGVADFTDCRTDRINIQTWHQKPRLQVVRSTQAAS
jgi:hypothetical protein